MFYIKRFKIKNTSAIKIGLSYKKILWKIRIVKGNIVYNKRLLEITVSLTKENITDNNTTIWIILYYIGNLL